MAKNDNPSNQFQNLSTADKSYLGPQKQDDTEKPVDDFVSEDVQYFDGESEESHDLESSENTLRMTEKQRTEDSQ